MAVPFSNTKVRVPKGFQNILEGLAREVLRSQPKDIFEFGCSYFEGCMKEREETGHDPAVHGSKLEDRFYNNDSFKNPSVDPSNPQQQDAAVKIQTQVRQHQAVKEVLSMEEQDAAVTIQAGFRGYTDRQKVLEKKDPEEYERRQKEIEARLANSQNTGEEEEVDIDLNDPEVEKAAVKIQAGFKGFKARKEVKETKSLPMYSWDAEADEEPAIAKVQPTKVLLTSEEVAPNEETAPSPEEVAPEDTASAPTENVSAAVEDVSTPVEDDSAASAPVEDASAPVEDASAPVEDASAPTAAAEEVDIDLEDPEVQAVTLKMQAKFKLKSKK